MTFRDVLIAAAVIEVINPGSIERGAKAAANTFTTILRNMPPASPQPTPYATYIPPITTFDMSAIPDDAIWDRCRACGEQRVIRGKCYGACLLAAHPKAGKRNTGRKRGRGRNKSLNAKPPGRHLLTGMPAIEVKPEPAAEPLQPAMQDAQPAQRATKHKGRQPEAISELNKRRLAYFYNRRFGGDTVAEALSATVDAYPSGKDPRRTIAAAVKKYFDGGEGLKKMRDAMTRLKIKPASP